MPIPKVKKYETNKDLYQKMYGECFDETRVP